MFDNPLHEPIILCNMDVLQSIQLIVMALETFALYSSIQILKKNT
jgi:hypothetical protein